MNSQLSVRVLLQQCGQSLQAGKSSIPSRCCSAYITRRPAVRGVWSVPFGLNQRRKLSKMTKKEDAHQHQAGNSTDRDIDQWKYREPYRVHKDPGDFDVKWEGQCHCGKVQYQLSRDKPLAAKYCHCTTCQRLHGVSDVHVMMTSRGAH